MEAAPDPDALVWGMDLFNHGFYWEAHEAWEELWRTTSRSTPRREALHGLILMAACGVKLREGKLGAARRHGERAATFLRRADAQAGSRHERLGIALAALATKVEQAVQPQARSWTGTIVFDFALAP